MMALVLLMGCSPTKVQPPVIQSSLLVKCPETLPLVGGKTGDHLLLGYVQWRSVYNDCKERHNGLVESLENKKGE